MNRTPQWTRTDHRGVVSVDQMEFGWDEEFVGPAPEPSKPDPPEPARRGPSPEDDIMRRADELYADLKRETGLTIQLRITDNRSTIMSMRVSRTTGVTKLGLHHLFLDAPPPVRRALAQWVRRPKAKQPGGVLDRFIKSQEHRIRPREPRAVACQTQGRFHDLAQLYEEVNREEFEGEVDCPITWGKMPKVSRSRRSIRFGSYTPGDHIIRIHPLLDQDFVPRFLVRYIVFHEMLHAHMGIEELPGGRRSVHPPAFRARERAYDDFNRASEWIENPKNLKQLLSPVRVRRA